MGITVHYLDPAGNVTAIVCDAAAMSNAERLAISRDILDKGLAEQVAFEVSSNRIEMMGGEFCGNASRAYGYLKALDIWESGQHELSIEISGANAPVLVKVDIDEGESFAEMPRPLGVDSLIVDGKVYPVVRMEGIDHMIVRGAADKALVLPAVEAMLKEFGSDACGVMFLSEDGLVPVVHVRETESTVWESSCGSGSVATAWYLSKGDSGDFVLSQPGGQIKVIIDKGRIMMGGMVRII